MTEVSSYNAEDGSNDQLVAYLDGELDAESSLQIERRLAEDESFRRELQQLQRAWDMLDELPKAEVSESFTQTTVEMVALSAERALEQQSETVQRKRQRRWILAASGLVVAAVASFWVMTALLARPNEQLVRDLPVIEDVDLYRYADSVEFLKQLDQSRLFDEEVENGL